MELLLTNEECTRIIAKLSKEFCVRPDLITTRLLSEEDMEDLRTCNFPIDELELHIKLWIRAGMPDYAHGKTESYADEQCRLKAHIPSRKDDRDTAYVKPFINRKDLT